MIHQPFLFILKTPAKHKHKQNLPGGDAQTDGYYSAIDPACAALPFETTTVIL